MRKLMVKKYISWHCWKDYLFFCITSYTWPILFTIGTLPNWTCSWEEDKLKYDPVTKIAEPSSPCLLIIGLASWHFYTIARLCYSHSRKLPVRWNWGSQSLKPKRPLFIHSLHKYLLCILKGQALFWVLGLERCVRKNSFFLLRCL